MVKIWVYFIKPILTMACILAGVAALIRSPENWRTVNPMLEVIYSDPARIFVIAFCILFPLWLYWPKIIHYREKLISHGNSRHWLKETRLILKEFRAWRTETPSEERESGIWTPEIAGSNTAGEQEYREQTGNYVKRDDGVWEVYFNISMAAKDPNTEGILMIMGLPVTINEVLGAHVGNYSDFNLVHDRPIMIRIEANIAHVNLVTGGNNILLTADNLTDTSSISGTLNYR